MEGGKVTWLALSAVGIVGVVVGVVVSHWQMARGMHGALQRAIEQAEAESLQAVRPEPKADKTPAPAPSRSTGYRPKTRGKKKRRRR